MKLRSYVVRIALAGVVMGSSAAQAADCIPSIPDGGPTGIPSFADISVPGGVIACAGFYGANINSGNASDLSTVQSLLASASWSGYGLSTTGPIEQINTAGPTINFAIPLVGLSLVAFHWGNFAAQSNPAGNVSALYLFDAGASLDSFTINVTGGLSNAAVWATSPVPEPQAYTLAIAALAVLGLFARRSSRTS